MVEQDVIAWPNSDNGDFDLSELRRFLSEIIRDRWVVTAVVPAPGGGNQLLVFVTRQV